MKKAGYYFYISLAFALWFALTSSAWTYLMNVFISFPFGIASYLLWRKGKRISENEKPWKVIPYIWIFGGLISVVVLIYFLIYE